jgi:hypothetical protein
MAPSILPYILGASILTPPVIQSYSPASGSQGSMPSPFQVTVTFSEVMELGSVSDANNWVLTTSVGDNLSRILSISVLNAGTGQPTKVLLTLSLSAVTTGQSFTLTALNRIVNLAGIPLGGTLSATFTNGATPAAPTILSWSPTSGNLGLMGPVFTAVATFSQAMDAATVTNLANWAVSCNFGTITLASVTYDATLQAATIQVDLTGVSPGFGFAITGGTGILDSWGQSLSGEAGVPYTYLGPALADPPLQNVLLVGNSAGSTDIDLNFNQGLNWRFENLSALPAAGNAGRVLFNTTDGRFYGDDGTSFGPIGGSIGTPATVPVYDGSGNLISSATTATQLSYLDATSSIQTQLNGKQASLGYTAENTANKGVANGYASLDSSGLIPVNQIPPAALERLVIVADQAARFALTTATVQDGDTVKQNDTGVMYFVVDDTNLGNASGYAQYTAGIASSVAWTGITGIPAPVSALLGTNTGDQTITLTGDVTGSGTGSFAATVASVGGSTAANVHAAEVLVNTAQSGNKFLASPANGSSGASTMRAIVPADLPAGTGLPVISGSTAAPNNITAAGGVSPSSTAAAQFIFVQGSGGAITVTANPQLSAGGTVGQIAYLVGCSDVNTLTLADGNGLSLNGGITLYNNSVLAVFWNGTVWSELYRR